ncbi:hypothetical protein AGMMS4956_04790 [Bacteroidia bacterium]|nr:hypothetical protein AGMMS4956_04790 [Bacteroidia bacterium]
MKQKIIILLFASYTGTPGFALNDPMLMTAGSSGVLSLWRKSFSTLKQVNFLVETYESSKNQASNFALACNANEYAATLH